MADFEALNLNITSNSEAASAGIESLVKSLTALKSLTASFKDTAVEKTLQNISRLSSGIVDSISTLNIDSGFSSGIVNGLNQITTAVDAISDASIERIERLASALERLGAPGMPDIDVQTRTSESARSAREIADSFARAIPAGIGTAFGSVASSTKSVLGFAANGAISSIKGITGALGMLNKGFLLGKLGSTQFISSLARIAKYRFLRTLIKGITDGIKTGLQNVAHYSNEANAALSNFTTGSLYLKNSLGAALYPAIASLIGIFNALINVVVRAINIVNMFFSILGGKGTYIKATKQTQDYAGALGGAAGAAGALKQELMGFDEINALSPSGGGGGGGGGGLDYGAMFEEVPVESWLADMIESGNFSALGAKIAEKINTALGDIPWSKAYAGAQKAAQGLTSLINGFFGEIDPKVIGDTIAGIINTAAIFVGDFFYDTNFELIGTRIKDAIVIAIHGINKNALAKAITGKLSAAVRFLKGLLPTTSAEWATVTDSVADMINAAILAIPASDIGTVISRVIVGGLSLITSLAEAGTLTNITSAVIEAIKTAFAGITKEDVQRAWDAVKSDLFNALKLLADINIEIAGIEFNGITAALSGMALFSVLKSALGRSMSVTGFKSAVGAFTLFTGVSILIESIVSLLSPIINGEELSAGDILDKIKQAFVGVGLIALSRGSLTGAAISLAATAAISVICDIKDLIAGDYEVQSDAAFKLITKALFGALSAGIAVSLGAGGLAIVATASIAILVSDVLFDGSALADSYLSDAVNQSIDEAVALISQFTDQEYQIRALSQALTEISGITIPENWVGANLATYFAGSGIEDGAVNVEGLTESLNAFASAVQRAAEEGTLDELIANIGLVGDAATEASSTVSDATSETESATNALQGNADKMAEAMGGYDTAVTEAAAAIDNLKASTTNLPTEYVIDANSLNELKTAANETSSAIGGISAFVTIIQKALEKLASGNLFTPLVTSASNAKEASEGLKSTISGIPDSKTISLTLANQSTVISKLNNIKKTISGISGKTISIQVKAGLTSGAKSFLTTLKGITSGSTAAAIGQLLSLSQFASGGFPKSGDIFMANENGRQELVGRIGSQPAVANQDQIGDAIFRYMDEHAQNGGGINTDELASAIVRGIKASGLGVVKLDGKTISGSINRETQRSGKPAIQF